MAKRWATNISLSPMNRKTKRGFGLQNERQEEGSGSERSGGGGGEVVVVVATWGVSVPTRKEDVIAMSAGVSSALLSADDVQPRRRFDGKKGKSPNCGRALCSLQSDDDDDDGGNNAAAVLAEATTRRLLPSFRREQGR